MYNQSCSSAHYCLLTIPSQNMHYYTLIQPNGADHMFHRHSGCWSQDTGQHDWSLLVDFMCGGSARGYTYSAEWYGTLRQYFQVRHAMLVWTYCTDGIRDESFCCMLSCCLSVQQQQHTWDTFWAAGCAQKVRSKVLGENIKATFACTAGQNSC